MEQYRNFEDFIEEVAELLKEIKEEQSEMNQKVEHYHKINMQKFAKLREFNEICDMTNQVFERRISNIEQKLSEVVNKIK